MAEKTNQQKLDDIWWILCDLDGRQFLAELVGGRAADKTLNTPIQRGGDGASIGDGNTTLAGMVSWNDSHVIAMLSAVAASSAASGATVDQISSAVKQAIAESVVKVAVSVEGTPQP